MSLIATVCNFVSCQVGVNVCVVRALLKWETKIVLQYGSCNWPHRREIECMNITNVRPLSLVSGMFYDDSLRDISITKYPGLIPVQSPLLQTEHMPRCSSRENQITTGRAAVSNIINETARPTYIFFKSELKLVCLTDLTCAS